MSETAVSIDWDRSKSEDEDDDEEEEEEYSSPVQSFPGPLPPPSANFEKDRHLVYLEMMYELLPYHYQSQEINRLTLAHFIISGLHFLGARDRVDKDVVAKWVLSFQAMPSNRVSLKDGEFYGFFGSRSSQFPIDENGDFLTHNSSHLASTYCALAILKVTGHDLSTIDSELLLLSMKNLQQDDGSFMPIHIGGETDLRFVYCAAAICYMLDNWSGMDKEKAKNYILNCQSYDGGFGLIPGSESHGGATYCAIASLRLMGFIGVDLLSNDSSSSVIEPSLLLNWCLQRQANDGGFQGRTNKPSDTCYAFWIGAVLKLIGGDALIDKIALRKFLLSCQSKYGGFSKFPGQLPDLYHSYYGYTAFSLLEEPSLSPLCPELGLPLLAASGI
ncbi:PREDICTED: geranylgeranyl transferase type-1 subunit beta [Camelina sativa]|uniref:Geranylgeranyl transferase type-1 subunit beta n=1 Tax=Camelina sativa TaxID=90675 RepID=A0ABM0Z181_CAMSA|nr:PREDICTED: geranylgeranyl transferase type-1 subunit beta [Camelina sativa]